MKNKIFSLTFILSALSIYLPANSTVYSICRVCASGTNQGGCTAEGNQEYCKPNTDGPACCGSVLVDVLEPN